MTLRVLDPRFHDTREALRSEVLDDQREKGGHWLEVELAAKLLADGFGHDAVDVHILIELKLVLRSTCQRKRKVRDPTIVESRIGRRQPTLYISSQDFLFLAT